MSALEQARNEFIQEVVTWHKSQSNRSAYLDAALKFRRAKQETGGRQEGHIRWFRELLGGKPDLIV